MPLSPDESREWLETDGLGGFAMGTASGVRTRSYHAILTVALRPPAERVALVKDLEAWVETERGSVWLTPHRYRGGHVHPVGPSHLADFRHDPWPTWRYRLPSGHRLTCELFLERHRRACWLRWTLGGAPEHGQVARLRVRPLLGGSPLHHVHRENPAFDFGAEAGEGRGVVRWRPYAALPAVIAASSGAYRHAPEWFRAFQLDEEAARGLESVEDLASPGGFEFDLLSGPAVMALSTEEPVGDPAPAWDAAAERERVRRGRFGADALARAADHYIVRRDSGLTVIAGYPWFGDWGRDTFIALRGLCLATGRLDEARAILVEWAGHVSRGMLPNRFPDAGEAPEYNSVDASLWYVVAAGEYMDLAAGSLDARDRDRLRSAVDAILDGYAAGTRHAIRVDGDGLVAAGEPGVQLTWMDAKCGEWVVTPRIGKPVEIQALWVNALSVAARWSPARAEAARSATEAFNARFWNAALGCLFDVVDADHRRGAVDDAVRPNQVLAVGGLPVPLLTGARAASVVRTVRERLWTPLGLRTLDPGHPSYQPRYQGDQRSRDGAYHQGTVWPWLMGAFVEAHLRVAGGAPASLEEAGAMLAGLRAHVGEAGLGHVSEVFDADPPRRPAGCPFQAWSVAELIRAERLVARG
ncbi:MAG: glycogen debranching protein [Phycisphaerae bacterium]|nr:glycogen debranching protein [Phycisphaerae bacterium]